MGLLDRSAICESPHLIVINMQNLSHKTLSALLKQYPDWEEFVTGELEGIIIDVPALQNPSMHKGLFIRSDEAGIEVNLGDDHDHFFPWDYDSDELLIEDTCEFVRDVVEEKIVSASFKNGDAWIGSCWLEPQEDARTAWKFGKATFVRLKSWRGTYDQEINL
jgi:hypothetical protein